MKTYWIHLDMSHPEYLPLVKDLTIVHRQRKPKNVLSINVNQYKTEALIKLPDVSDKDYASQLADDIRTKGLLIRTFTLDDHIDALTLVTGIDWTGPIDDIIAR